jgi:hypothetical protein
MVCSVMNLSTLVRHALSSGQEKRTGRDRVVRRLYRFPWLFLHCLDVAHNFVPQGSRLADTMQK